MSHPSALENYERQCHNERFLWSEYVEWPRLLKLAAYKVLVNGYWRLKNILLCPFNRIFSQIQIHLEGTRREQIPLPIHSCCRWTWGEGGSAWNILKRSVGQGIPLIVMPGLELAYLCGSIEACQLNLNSTMLLLSSYTISYCLRQNCRESKGVPLTIIPTPPKPTAIMVF